MKFEYIAVNQKGEEINGIFEAELEEDVITKLRGCGLYPIQVAPKGKLKPPIEINTSKNNKEVSSELENLMEKQAGIRIP